MVSCKYAGRNSIQRPTPWTCGGALWAFSPPDQNAIGQWIAQIIGDSGDHRDFIKTGAANGPRTSVRFNVILPGHVQAA
jgi:hypothetical protein